MVVLQALLAWITRSIGSFFKAAFGWSVAALFGPRPKREQVILSAAVAGAAAWPLLVLGVAVPRFAAFVLAFVPLSRSIPNGALRAAWAIAAAAVPVGLGILLGREERSAASRSWWIRVAEGLPATAGIACGFVFVALAVPIRKAVAFVRRRVSTHAPAVVTLEAYGDLADVVESALGASGLDLPRRPAPLGEDGPLRLLRWVGGPLFRRRLPARLVAFRGSGLSIVLTPNGVAISGPEGTVTRVRGILSEALTFSHALQTLEPAAQKIERRLGALVHPGRPRGQGPTRTTDSLDAIARQILAADVSWEDFQVLHREMLQAAQVLGRRKPLFRGSPLGTPAPREREARRR